MWDLAAPVLTELVWDGRSRVAEEKQGYQGREGAGGGLKDPQSLNVRVHPPSPDTTRQGHARPEVN